MLANDTTASLPVSVLMFTQTVIGSDGCVLVLEEHHSYLKVGAPLSQGVWEGFFWPWALLLAPTMEAQSAGHPYTRTGQRQRLGTSWKALSQDDLHHGWSIWPPLPTSQTLTDVINSVLPALMAVAWNLLSHLTGYLTDLLLTSWALSIMSQTVNNCK